MIKNAFQCFDEENSGLIHEERLRELLTTMGDRYTDEQVRVHCYAYLTALPVTLHQVDDLFRDAPIKNGQFNYIEFTRMLKHGTKDKDDEMPTAKA